MMMVPQQMGPMRIPISNTTVLVQPQGLQMDHMLTMAIQQLQYKGNCIKNLIALTMCCGVFWCFMALIIIAAIGGASTTSDVDACKRNNDFRDDDEICITAAQKTAIIIVLIMSLITTIISLVINWKLYQSIK